MRPDPINWGFVNSCVLAEMAAVLLCGPRPEETRMRRDEDEREDVKKKLIRGLNDELIPESQRSLLLPIVCVTIRSMIHQRRWDRPLNTDALFHSSEIHSDLMPCIKSAFVLPASQS